MEKKYHLEYDSSLSARERKEAYERMKRYGTWNGYWWTPNPSRSGRSAMSQSVRLEDLIRREGFVCGYSADDITSIQRAVRLGIEMVKDSGILPSESLIAEASHQAVVWVNNWRAQQDEFVSLDNVMHKVGKEFGLEVWNRS